MPFINVVKVENSCCGSQAAHPISNHPDVSYIWPRVHTVPKTKCIKQKLRFPLRHIKMIWIKKCKRAFNFNLCLSVSASLFALSFGPISLCNPNAFGPVFHLRHTVIHSLTHSKRPLLGSELFVSFFPICINYSTYTATEQLAAIRAVQLFILITVFRRAICCS